MVSVIFYTCETCFKPVKLFVIRPPSGPLQPTGLIKRVITPRSANLQNESIELAKIRTKMISL